MTTQTNFGHVLAEMGQNTCSYGTQLLPPYNANWSCAANIWQKQNADKKTRI